MYKKVNSDFKGFLTSQIYSEILTNEFYGLPGYYKLHSSRRFFYRESLEPMVKVDAYLFCKEHVDRRPTWTSKAYLPLPLSDEENEFIRKIVPGKSLWIAMSSGQKFYSELDYWFGPSEWGYSIQLNIGPDFPYAYTNWRSGDGVPAGLSGNHKTETIMSPADGKWLAADQDEKHYAVCIFRF